MPGTVTVPGTLKGHARDIWRSAFLGSYDSTCKGRDDKDACSAAIAWAAVKDKYKKGEGGTWVRKSWSEIMTDRASDAVMGPVSPVPEGEYPAGLNQSFPDPGQMTGSGSKAHRWREAFSKALANECRNASDPVGCARAAASKAVGEPEGEEERTMEEMAMKAQVVQEPDGPLAERRRLREYANAADFKLIESLGAERIVRPERISNMTWRSLPESQKTVRAEALRRIVERNYAQAVEDAHDTGWKVEYNKFQPAEHILSTMADTDVGPILMRAIFVRAVDSIDWKLQVLQQFLSQTTATDLGPFLVRHTDQLQPVDKIDLPKAEGRVASAHMATSYPASAFFVRGGPGSGFYGHAGRPGELGGSSPGEGGDGKSTEAGTRGAGFRETRGGRSNMPGQKGRDFIRSWMEPKAGVGLDQQSEQVAEHAVDLFSSLSLDQLRDAQEEVDARLSAGRGDAAHLQALSDVLRRAVDKREFPEKSMAQRGGAGSGHYGHAGRPGELGGSAPGDSGAAGRENGQSGKGPQQAIAESPSGYTPSSGLTQEFAASLPVMSISELAREARRDWGSNVNFAAKPYLEAMGSLNSIDDAYMFDSGRSMVSYFLANAGQWKGERARAIKSELKRRLKG